MARPKPPVSPGTDLRDFDFMPLNVVQLDNSETWATADGWQSRALINLWCKAWHQVPAGSLPNNEKILAKWADVPDWETVREVALRGFVECSDDRLYHLRLSEKVREAFRRKEESARVRELDRKRKRYARDEKAKQNQDSRPVGKKLDVPRTKAGRPEEFRSMRRTGTLVESSPDRSESTSRAREGWLDDDDSRIENELDEFAGRALKLVQGFVSLREEAWGEEARVNQPAPRMTLESQARGFLQQGLSVPAGLAALAKAMANAASSGKSPPTGLNAYKHTLRDATAKASNGGEDLGWFEREDRRWALRLGGYRRDGTWLAEWGAKPGEIGCTVPHDLLTPEELNTIPAELNRRPPAEPQS